MTVQTQQQNLPQAKPWWKSKTVWFNTVSVVVVVATILTDPVTYGPEVARWAALGLAVGNTLLRLITKEPVALKPAARVAAPEKKVEEAAKD